LQRLRQMRAIAAAAAVAVALGFPFSASAQDKSAVRTTRPAAGVPVVTVAPAISDADTADDATVVARRFAEELSARLQPIEQRLREDARLRRAGAVIGLSAAAIGALRGQQTLTFVGTQAVRLGLDRQLSAIRARSGVSIEPTIGHRTIAVTVSVDSSKFRR